VCICLNLRSGYCNIQPYIKSIFKGGGISPMTITFKLKIYILEGEFFLFQYYIQFDTDSASRSPLQPSRCAHVTQLNRKVSEFSYEVAVAQWLHIGTPTGRVPGSIQNSPKNFLAKFLDTFLTGPRHHVKFIV